MNILSLIPTGIHNKVSASELARRAGYASIRELQQRIESERRAGAVICSTAENGGGYFLHESISELRQHVKTVDNRARSTWESNAAARRTLQELEETQNN